MQCRGIASPVFGRESTRTGSAQHSAHAPHSPTCSSLPTTRRSTRPWDDRLVPGTINSFYGVIVPRASQCLGVIFWGDEGACAAQQRMNAGCKCCTAPLPITMWHTQRTQHTERGHLANKSSCYCRYLFFCLLPLLSGFCETERPPPPKQGWKGFWVVPGSKCWGEPKLFCSNPPCPPEFPPP